MSAVTQQLTDSLTFESCLDVAVFVLAIAHRMKHGEPCSQLVQDLPHDWAIAARALLPADMPEFEIARHRATLRRLV